MIPTWQLLTQGHVTGTCHPRPAPWHALHTWIRGRGLPAAVAFLAVHALPCRIASATHTVPAASTYACAQWLGFPPNSFSTQKFPPLAHPWLCLQDDLSTRQKQEALYGQTAVHATFGDVELAQITLRGRTGTQRCHEKRVQEGWEPCRLLPGSAALDA
jgi:hypothetical protein